LTIDASHLLVFQVKDVEPIYAQFGAAAVNAGLSDTLAAMDAHAGGLLGRHQEVAIPLSAKPSRWWRGFNMTGAGSAMVDVAEQSETLAAAAARTGHRLLLDIFGTSTGARLAFAAAVMPLPQPAPQDMDAWLDATWREDSSRRANLAPDAETELRSVIAGQGLRTLLQPIVSLPSGQVVGYEALSRGPQGSRLEMANALFGAGERFNLTVELELACARQVVALAGRLPQGRWLSINLGLAALAQPGAVESLARPGILLEITEHLPLDQADAYAGFFAQARRLGARLALDDTGCGFADMEAARSIRPDIAKLCITVTRNAGRSDAHLAEIASTVAELRSVGAEVLAEGVETPEQAIALTEAGASLAQGWHFGRPVPWVEII
jgi:EAL domain-containing protein (putative c-di-GMP-specific phosphodiesterase class I)